MPVLAEAPDLILHNARVCTQDPHLPFAQAVAVRKHRILAVGSNDEVLALARSITRRIDAEGALLLPGLCDAHIHFGDWSLNLRAVPLADTRSKAEMLARVGERAQSTPPGAWIVSRGWNESRWGETAFPSAADLDAVTGPAIPALLYRADMHSAVANSAALRAAGIGAQTPDPAEGIIERDAQGAPTGLLKESATWLVADVVPPATQAERQEALRLGMAALHRLGITAIHDQRYGSAEGAAMLRAFQQLRRAGNLQLRVACNILAEMLPHAAALGVEGGLGDDRLRLGHAKLFADGSLGSRTAWMLEPFARLDPAERDNFGVVVTPPEAMAETFRAAAAAGFPVSIHAIGDRANREVLDLFEELAALLPPPALPHRIEHVQTIHPQDLPRLARLNLTASVQPTHALDDMETADLLLGERAAHTYTFRALLDAGARLAFGSDAPVADPSPWLGLHAAVVRQRPERAGMPPWYGAQRITLDEALHAYTLAPAEAAGWQRTIGSLRIGARADLILLDRDLFALSSEAVAAGALAQAQVRLTLFDGAIVWEA